MVALTPLRPARVLPGVLVAGLAAVVTAPVAVAAPAWTARVLPAGTEVSRPVALLDGGQVVGVDSTATSFGEGQPWRWTAAAGRRDLGLLGGTSARVDDVANAANVVGTTYRTDTAGVRHSTAVRWQGRRPVALLPTATGDTAAQATNRNGDAVVGESSPTAGMVAWLVSPGAAPVQLPLFAQQQNVVSMNDARAMVVFSRGPGTIGPGGFSVRAGDQNFDLGLSGIRDFPSCVTSITQSGYVAGHRFLIGTLRQESVLWRDGVRTLLPAADGVDALVSCAEHGVNEQGHAVGVLAPPLVRPGEPLPTSPTQAVLWRDGAARVLATDTATRTVRPVALNERDVVVATVDDPTGASEPGPALFLPGGRRVDLPVPAGLRDVRAVDVNERNQVVGTAQRGTSTVTVLWTPRVS